jgi:hypothetical protein
MILRSVILLGLLFLFVPGSFSLAQSNQAQSDSPARALLDAATPVMGGQKLLDIKTMIGRGKYTQFTEKGELALLEDFVDYIVYPDKERTEFGKGKKRYIQTNVGSAGWIYDGEQKAIREQTPEQVENFQRALRHNLDHLLRRSRQPDVKLRYLGEKEIWFRQRGRGVEIRLPVDGGKEEVVELYIDPLTREPVKVAFENEEDRFFLYRESSGVNWPMRIDHYKAGVQTSRIAYNSIEFNQSVDPRLFEKPENPNKVK